MIIYKITNKINGKFYIGKTIDCLKNRWSKHCRPSSKCTYLSSAIKKYGPDNFKLQILIHCTSKKHLNELEQMCIAKYKPDYNLTKGGDGGALTGPALEKMKLNVSRSLRGVKKPKRSKRHSENISKSLTGKINPKKRKPIKCSNGIEYDSIVSASKSLNLSKGNIHSVLNGRRKSTGGLYFEYR